MNELATANKALALASELDAASSEMEYNHVVSDWKLLSDSADMLRSQEKYINRLHRLLNANNIGAGRDLLTGEIIPFEVQDERK